MSMDASKFTLYAKVEMNLVFNINKTFEHEFTSNNLIKSDLLIERISMKAEKEVLGTCLVLDRVNN